MRLFFANYLAFIVAAFFLGIIATGFSWVIFLIVSDRLPKEAELFVVEEYQPANISVDLQGQNGPVHGSWKAFAQGGEEPGGVGMLQGTEGTMSQVSPKYVRLDHIFDDDYYFLVSGSGNDLKLDWTKLDATVDHILAMGAKPFFSLGYMPSSIAGTKIDVPSDWGRWQWLVDQTIRHYSGTKGIEDVYYEVWNEPDLESFGSWKYYGDKSYITLYDVSARAALALRNSGSVKPFKFGGPAITALYRNWVIALVNHTKAQGLPLDFISWHRYSYHPAQFRQDLQDINLWLGDGHPYELVISEWGPDPGKTDVYSGRYAAAHAVAVSREFLDLLDYGFAFEVKDGPDQGNMGWGVLTHNSAGLKAKPRYYAFAYLKDMDSGERLSLSGEGSNVSAWAVEDEGAVNLILSNFSPSGSTAEVVPVTFVNAIPGRYRLQWETLSGISQDRIIRIIGNEIQEEFQIPENDVLKLRLTPIQETSSVVDIEGESENSQEIVEN